MNLQGPVSAIIISSCLGREELSGEDSGGGSGSGNDEDGWGGGEESQLKPNFENIFKDYKFLVGKFELHLWGGPR